MKERKKLDRAVNGLTQEFYNDLSKVLDEHGLENVALKSLRVTTVVENYTKKECQDAGHEWRCYSPTDPSTCRCVVKRGTKEISFEKEMIEKIAKIRVNKALKA